MTEILNRARTAALVALAEHGQTTDIQDLLVAGNPSRTMPPGALDVMVRAVMRAMREPTPAMIAAPWVGLNDEKAKLGILRLGPGEGVTNVWRAMIDAAQVGTRPEGQDA